MFLCSTAVLERVKVYNTVGCDTTWYYCTVEHDEAEWDGPDFRVK